MTILFRVADSAEDHKVLWRVIRPVTIDMVDVKKFEPVFDDHSAFLTSVALLDAHGR